MSYNGSGTFVINTAGQPVVSGTVISSTAFNALTADLATGLSTAITKDGQTTPTANIPMGNNKITNLAVGTAATDAANLSQVQSTTAKLINSISGADTITGTMSPNLGAYATGQMFYFIAAGDNTGAVTLNIDSLGAKSVTRDGSVALAAGDIKSGEVVVVVYDGTRFQVVSQINSSGNATFANVSITSALNVGGVATVTGGATLNGGVVINELGADADTRIEGDTDANLVFVDASTDRVGIGTSSPGAKLEIKGSNNEKLIINADSDSANYQNQLSFKNNGTQYAALTSGKDSGNNSVGLVFYTGTSERMRLDASGNLGLGVTPSAWSAGKAIEIGNVGNGFWTFNGIENYHLNNAYYNNGWKYASTAPAGYYNQYNGTHIWATAASGTAGGTISFTQAMTLDASGNLGVGTTSPSNRLTVSGANTAARGQLSVVGASASPRITLYEDSTFYAAFAASGTDAYIGTESNTPFRFITNGSERARITAAGEFLVGKTTNAASPSGCVLSANGNCLFTITSSIADSLNLYNDTASAYRFYVTNGGTVFATNTTISAISDQRLKENIRDLDAGLDAVMALKPRKFDWKKGKGQDKKDVRGFIAQEFEQVFPDLIDIWKDPAPEGEEPYKSVRQDLIPVLVKAIQELKAELDAAKVKIAALEAK